MVIYNSADSDNLIQALSTNIKTAKEVFDKVKQGTQHLSSVIDSGTLSGSAYRAGQSLFESYITPMIQKLDSAIDDIQSDLDNYKKAEQHVRALDSHLDENYLKGMLNNTNQMIRLIEQKIQEDKKVMEKLVNLHFDELAQGLAEIPGLEQQLDNMKQLKHDYEKKIQALQTFVSSTNSLFTDSLQAFKYALQGVDIINQSKASVDGTITFPAGADMSWSSKLQGEKFSSQPTAKDKLLQKYANDPETLKQILAYTNEPLNMSVKSAEALYLSAKNSDTSMKDFNDKLSQWEQHYSEDKYSKDKFGSFQVFVGTMLGTLGLFDGIDEIFGAGVIADIELEEALGTETIAGGDLTEAELSQTADSISNINELDENKISHILQEHHDWEKVVENPKDWGQIKDVLSEVIESDGAVTKIRDNPDVFEKVATINNEKVAIQYRVVDGKELITNGWVSY